MRGQLIVRNNKVINTLDLDDGTYIVKISKRSDDKTLEQVRKLWATIGDISTKLYGDTSQKDNIYFQILHMAGQRTFNITMREDALEDFKKNKNVRGVYVVRREIINHIPYVLVDVCMVGISDMDKSEVAKVIDSCVKYANENGIETELERTL